MNLKITSLAIVALGLGITTGLSLASVTREQTQMKSLVTATHQRFGQLVDGDDILDFQGSTLGATDRYYNLTLSVKSLETIINNDYFDQYNTWWFWLTNNLGRGDHWVWSTNFYNYLYGLSGGLKFGLWNDMESLKALINNTNPHLYSGGGWGKFSLSDFKSTVEQGIAKNTRIKLRFYCDYEFLGHNKYAAMWYVD